MKRPSITVSYQDRDRLQGLINSALLDSRVSADNLSALENELMRAELRDEAKMPADVVAMHSTVRFVDLSMQEIERYTLVYPREADVALDKISVFAPIGTALLGYRVGDVVEWSVPAGKRRLRIIGVQQPVKEDLAALSVAGQ